MIKKNTYVDDIKHRKFIASLPCLITLRSDVQCAHIKHEEPHGTGKKSSDINCVPLCCEEHDLQHRMSEQEYWEPYLGVRRAKFLARRLYENTGDRQRCLELIMNYRYEAKFS